MRGCDQELCAYWTGQGCACTLLDIKPEPEPPAWLDDLIEATFAYVASIPPMRWLNTLLGGPVRPLD